MTKTDDDPYKGVSAEDRERALQQNIEWLKGVLAKMGYSADVVAQALWDNTEDTYDLEFTPGELLSIALDEIYGHRNDGIDDRCRAAIDLMAKYGPEASLPLRQMLDFVCLDLPLVSDLDHIELHRQQTLDAVRQDIIKSWQRGLEEIELPDGYDVDGLLAVSAGRISMPEEYMFANAICLSEGSEPPYKIENIYYLYDPLHGDKPEYRLAIRKIWNSIIAEAAMTLIEADGPLMDGID